MIERTIGIGLRALFVGLYSGIRGCIVIGNARNTVGYVVHHVQAGDILLLQEVNCLTFLFTENGHQHIGARDFLFTGRLNMEHGALKHPLKAERRLGFTFHIIFGNEWRCRLDKLDQIKAQLAHIGAASDQDLVGSLIVQQSQQQVLDRHKFVAFGSGLFKSLTQRGFQISAQHSCVLPLNHCFLQFQREADVHSSSHIDSPERL